MDEKFLGKIDFEHNPFSMPHGGLEVFENKHPLEIFGMQYDLACNGYEILSGSIRNHNLELLVKAFGIVERLTWWVKVFHTVVFTGFQM